MSDMDPIQLPEYWVSNRGTLYILKDPCNIAQEIGNFWPFGYENEANNM